MQTPYLCAVRPPKWAKPELAWRGGARLKVSLIWP